MAKKSLQPVLFDRIEPSAAVDWVPLINRPTTVRPLSGMTRLLGGPPIFIKNDGLTSDHYGGNKPRKLEFLLARAQKEGARRVMTVGGMGSNHCLATAIHAGAMGLKTTLLLGPQPVTDHVRRQLLTFLRLGADLKLARDYKQIDSLKRSVSAQILASEGREPFWIPMGGTDALGDLGFVEAALELSEQIKAGAAPEPERLYIAAGTCGSLAGLVAGSCLAGLKTRMVGVRVAPEFISSKNRVVRLANEALEELGRRGAAVDGLQVQPDDFDYLTDFLGEGYAHPTRQASEAARMIGESEGIELETTYTGKALAGMIHEIRSGKAGGPALFWNTFNSADYTSAPPVDERWVERIPDSVKPHLGDMIPGG